MEFLAPLGLIGLIGIPILIIVYILKPRYQERTISSTYIWKLSLKYRKRKLPLQWLKSFLLIVQILLVALLVFLICQPQSVDTKGVAGKYEKIVIVDASASMSAEENGESRFDRAIAKATELARTTSAANPITIIVATDKPYYLGEENREVLGEYVAKKLQALECGQTEADYATAIQLATDVLQASLNEGSTSTKITLISDHEFAATGYIELINVSKDEWNVAILDGFSQAPDGNPIFVCNLRSYNKEATVTAVCEITSHIYSYDAVSQTTVMTPRVTKVSMPNVKLPVSYGDSDVQFTQVVFDEKTIKEATENNRTLKSFVSAKFYVEQNGVIVDDSFEIDNEFHVFGGEIEKFDVQIVSAKPMFIYAAVSALGTCNIMVINPSVSATVPKSSGYDLYIYDCDTAYASYYPKTNLPKDGAIWVINPNGDYSEIGFKTGTQITNGGATKYKANVNTDFTEHPLLEGVEDTYIYYGENEETTEKRAFEVTNYTTIDTGAGILVPLVNRGETDDSFIYTGITADNVKVIVFAFDLHYSDFPLTINYLAFTRNVGHYCLKQPLDSYLYDTGAEIDVNEKPNTQNIEVKYFEDDKEVVDNYDKRPYSFIAATPGVYTVTQNLADNTTVVNEVFVRISQNESNFDAVGGMLAGDEYKPTESTLVDQKQKIYTDISKYFAWALLAFLVVEWGLQYREQY